MSLIGKVLAATSQPGPPVPIGESGIWTLPGASHRGGTPEESFLRAYGINGTVFSNSALLAASTAGQQWKLFRQPKQDMRQRYTTADQGSDQRVEVVQHAALALLARPNPFWSQFRLFEISQLWQELTGKWHWVVTRAPGSPIPIGLWPVRPDRMTPVPDPEKYLRGWIYTAPDGLEKIPLEVTDVIYEFLPDPLDPYGGTGPVQSVLAEIDSVRYAAQYNRNFFANAARPDGVLSVDHRVSDEEWDDLTDRWREAHRGVSRAHRVAVLEGVTWVPTSTTQKDMDFANLMSTSGDRIREAWGIHKIMTGLTEDVNRANAQTGEEVFASWKVDPRLKRRRDTFNFQVLPLFGDTGKGVEFDYVYPMPRNREQDALELTSKSGAFAVLVASGADPAWAAQFAGLPPPKMIPSPPPGGLPVGTSGLGAPAAVPGESGQGGDALNRLSLRPWDSMAVLERQAAAWNALAGAR